MSATVSLFPRYSQRENLATNYVLLLLRLVYGESPTLFGRVLDDLLELGVAGDIGVRFEQQQKRGDGIPDGLILQSAFSLFIETKISDWFYKEQLERHAKALVKTESGRKVLLALAGGEIDGAKFEAIRRNCEEISDERVALYARSFEQLITALKPIESIPTLFDVLQEFTQFCRDEGLIHSWEGWLDAVNAADSVLSNVEAGAYFCPATGGSYSHQRCEYLGLYSLKSIRYIGRIRALVDVDQGLGTGRVLWKNNDEADSSLASQALMLVRKYRTDNPVRAILVDEFVPTDYEKVSRGGMPQHKRYFDVRAAAASSVDALAAWLRTQKWT